MKKLLYLLLLILLISFRTEAAVMAPDSLPCDASISSIPIPGTTGFHFYGISGPGVDVWHWEFGDGQTSDLQNVDHYYAQAGQYVVVLTVYDTNTLCFDSAFTTVIAGNPCFADFSYTILQGNTTVSFTDQSSPNIGTWQWDFGDGQTSSAQNPTHTYANPGVYDVQLDVISADSVSCFASTNQTISLVQQPCNASYTYNMISEYTVQFTDSSQGNINTWFWSFGDSTFSNEQNPVHSYNSAGPFYVCLTITGDSCQDTSCDTVFFWFPPDCQNAFTYQAVNLSVDFTGWLINNGPAAFAWSFGDGTSGTGNTVNHDYSSPGSYVVSLTTTTDSCSYTSTQTITLGDTNQFHQIWGQVFEGNFPLNSGTVYLFSADTNGIYFPYVDVDVIDSMGIYYFPYVPEGQYYIWAVPNDSSYLPTYYGDQVNWQNAAIVYTSQLTNPYNINLIPSGFLMTGNGAVNGTINTGRSLMTFVDKIRMLIRNENGDVLGFSNVAGDGSFDFSNIALGMYTLIPELPGCNSETITVMLTAEVPVVNLNLTYSNGKILGISTPGNVVTSSRFYPNPAGEELHAAIGLSSSADVKITLYDITGKVINTFNRSLSAGSNQLTISLADLRSGTYILEILAPDGSAIRERILRNH